MASIIQDSASGRFYIRFRYAGESYKRSLSTGDRHEANASLSRVNETLTDIKRGRLHIPDDADPALSCRTVRLRKKPKCRRSARWRTCSGLMKKTCLRESRRNPLGMGSVHRGIIKSSVLERLKIVPKIAIGDGAPGFTATVGVCLIDSVPGGIRSDPVRKNGGRVLHPRFVISDSFAVSSAGLVELLSRRRHRLRAERRHRPEFLARLRRIHSRTHGNTNNPVAVHNGLVKTSSAPQRD